MDSFAEIVGITKLAKPRIEKIKRIAAHTQIKSLNLPLEIRWRSSDPKSFSFWRIYLGTQIQYNFISDKIGALKKFTSVSTLNLGYNTWNFSIGYDLYPRLKEFESIQSTKLKILTIGLIFYIF